MSVKCKPSYIPLLNSKSEVNKGRPIIVNFDPKHRLWVLVRIEVAVLMWYPQSMF